jgi:sorbitol-specific phosphotransferase system component IIA
MTSLLKSRVTSLVQDLASSTDIKVVISFRTSAPDEHVIHNIEAALNTLNCVTVSE